MSKKIRPIRVIRDQIANLKITISSHEDQATVTAESVRLATEEFEVAKKKLEQANEFHKKNLNIIKMFNGKLDDLIKEESETNTAVKRSPTVSDHAVIRYIERVMNFDIDQIRRKIVGKDGQQIKTMGDGEIDRGDYSIVVNNNTVVTVMK